MGISMIGSYIKGLARQGLQTLRRAVETPQPAPVASGPVMAKDELRLSRPSLTPLAAKRALTEARQRLHVQTLQLADRIGRAEDPMELARLHAFQGVNAAKDQWLRRGQSLVAEAASLPPGGARERMERLAQNLIHVDDPKAAGRLLSQMEQTLIAARHPGYEPLEGAMLVGHHRNELIDRAAHLAQQMQHTDDPRQMVRLQQALRGVSRGLDKLEGLESRLNRFAVNATSAERAKAEDLVRRLLNSQDGTAILRELNRLLG